MNATDDARAERARERASWTGRVRRMDALPESELLELPPEVLVGLVTELTLEAWAMMGRPIPDYRRDEIPGCVIRPGEAGARG